MHTRTGEYSTNIKNYVTLREFVTTDKITIEEYVKSKCLINLGVKISILDSLNLEEVENKIVKKFNE